MKGITFGTPFLAATAFAVLFLTISPAFANSWQGHGTLIPSTLAPSGTNSSTVTTMTIMVTVSSASSSSSGPPTKNYLPAELQPYGSVIGVILLFVDGLIFGVATKKAILSAILVVVGLVLAGFVGLTIPFLSANNIWTHVLNIFISQARLIGPLLYTFPIFWITGYAIGIWKG